ncbi:hypothetical protein QBC37DRAFT_483905 [Rhypophila decipiens]|uniref:Uncharacterized protein n=1 Tax=Rhypophila decipiens TaxID=261697 RepID=A0AAN6Y6U1_9PEZI|nr:hypothetical protein QBC37DRAFT_483905 [Rhypophila decipiens]
MTVKRMSQDQLGCRKKRFLFPKVPECAGRTDSDVVARKGCRPASSIIDQVKPIDTTETIDGTIEALTLNPNTRCTIPSPTQDYWLTILWKKTVPNGAQSLILSPNLMPRYNRRKSQGRRHREPAGLVRYARARPGDRLGIDTGGMVLGKADYPKGKRRVAWDLRDITGQPTSGSSFPSQAVEVKIRVMPLSHSTCTCINCYKAFQSEPSQAHESRKDTDGVQHSWNLG